MLQEAPRHLMAQPPRYDIFSGARYFMELEDPKSDRRITGRRTDQSARVSLWEESCARPLGATRTRLELGTPGMPPIFSLEDQEREGVPCAPPTITVTAIDRTGELYAVTYFPLGIEAGTRENADGQTETVVAFRAESPTSFSMDLQEATRMGYYSFGELPPRVDCDATGYAFRTQVDSGSFANPRLISFVSSRPR